MKQRKIKNENDLLGLLIKLKDKNGDVDNKTLLSSSKTKSYSLDFLMRGLIDKHYVIYTCDTTTLTDLGLYNHISIPRRIFSWLITLLKFAVSYTLGVFSGIIATWLMIKLGIR